MTRATPGFLIIELAIGNLRETTVINHFFSSQTDSRWFFEKIGTCGV